MWSNFAARRLRVQRRGAVVVMAALFMVAFMAFLAFAIDLGYMYTVRNELQRTADSAAVAGCWELIDETSLTGGGNMTAAVTDAKTKAGQFAALNDVCNAAPSLGASDAVVGYIANPISPTSPFTTSYAGRPIAVQVLVQKSTAQNGRVPFFFARVMGHESAELSATATAASIQSFNGFQAPSNGDDLELLPFAIDTNTWNTIAAGTAADNYKFNSNGTVSAGADGTREVNLYPQGTGSPGNRGTVDIGSNNNSTADLARQIVDGVSQADLAYHGGKLEFNSAGTLSLNGDTGISAGVKDELASIIGKPRIIPVFTLVTGPGNNAQYTINKFVGIRILYVKLTGSMSSKAVIVQPAVIKARGGIPATTDGKSEFIYSPVWLVR